MSEGIGLQEDELRRKRNEFDSFGFEGIGLQEDEFRSSILWIA
jgi:hypothetical protein